MRRALVTFALLPYFFVAIAAWGGVEMGGHPGNTSIKPGAVRSFKLVGKVHAIRWVNPSGRSVVRDHPAVLPSSLRLSPPPGTWSDIELLFDGPVSLQRDDGQTVTVALDTLLLPLDEPVTGGQLISLELDLLAPVGIWSAGRHIDAADPLIHSVRDAALARIR